MISVISICARLEVALQTTSKANDVHCNNRCQVFMRHAPESKMPKIIGKLRKFPRHYAKAHACSQKVPLAAESMANPPVSQLPYSG